MLISIVTPFANEKENLKEFVERTIKGGKKAKVDIELIFIDDGSTDGSGEIAKELQQKHSFIKLFTHKINRGLTEALKTGFKNSSGEIIFFIPSDLESHPDEDIPALMQGFDKGFDVVCGRRINRKEIKIILSSIYNDISNFLFKTKLRDMNWIKAFKKECLNDLILRSDWHRFIVQILFYKGYKITEVPVNWYKRKSGKSHFGLKRIPISFFDALSVKFLMVFTKAPMRLFGGFGGLQIVSAILITAWMLYSSFILKTSAFRLRPLLYFSVALFLSGIIFFFMGFIAELIVNLNEEIKNQKNDKN